MRRDRELAIKMRQNGKSYNEINATLGIPKGTLSGWFRGIKFSVDVKKRLIDKAKIKWAQNITAYNKERAAIILKKAEEMQDTEAKRIKDINNRELWLLGTALYWAEGSKRERWQVRFTNSDPAMIKFMMNYFRNICKIREEKFKLTLQLHPNVSEKEAKEYWGVVANIPESQFCKTLFAVSKASKYKRDPKRLPYGTLRIAVSDVNMVNRIRGWLKGLTQLV